jgi:hypothetical protein
MSGLSNIKTTTDIIYNPDLTVDIHINYSGVIDLLPSVLAVDIAEENVGTIQQGNLYATVRNSSTALQLDDDGHLILSVPTGENAEDYSVDENEGRLLYNKQ